MAQTTKIPYEILFRDQSSKKEGLLLLNTYFSEKIKNGKLRIWNGKNLMHSGGHNFLYAEKQYEYYICASIDMVYEKTMLSSLEKAIHDFPESKVWGGKILQQKEFAIDSVGISQTWYGRFFERGYGLPPSAYEIPEKVFGISGALFCIHSSSLDPNEPLFEPSLHYKNDVELMLRLQKKKYSVQYFPDVLAHHDRLANENMKKSIFILESSLQGQKFIMKHLSWYSKIPVNIFFGMQFLRYFFAVVKNFILKRTKNKK